jgi:hypothetical protein
MISFFFHTTDEKISLISRLSKKELRKELEAAYVLLDEIYTAIHGPHGEAMKKLRDWAEK